MRVLAVFLSLLIVAIVYPICIIASLNYLFHFNIAYSVLSILSIICLTSIFTFKLKFNRGE